MSSILPALIYTRDDDFGRKAAAHLLGTSETVVIDRCEELDRILARQCERVIVMDLRGDRVMHVISRLEKEWSAAIVISIGDPHSEPALQARQSICFNIASIDDCDLIRDAVGAAFEMLELRRENSLLKSENSKLSVLAENAGQSSTEGGQNAMPDRIFSRSLHRHSSMNALLELISEELVEIARVSRAGIFLADTANAPYRYRAGFHCGESPQTSIAADSPVARWLEANNQIVARQTLEHVSDHHDRMLLSDLLKQLGAEVMVPLRTQQRLLGFIFLGPHAVGLPFRIEELEGLRKISQQVSTTIENSIIYEHVALQKSLAETLLNSIPFAFIVCGGDGLIRWVNRSARNMLGLGDESFDGLPVEELGPSVADALRRALDKQEMLLPEPLALSGRQGNLSLQTRTLAGEEGCLGALAIVKALDGSPETREKEEQLERSAFWTGLAAAMAHEIHNPLVTIKTYAQLMPERYMDAEFRTDYSRQLLQEVDHLTNLVSQIGRFATPPQLNFRPIELKSAILKGIEIANGKYPKVLLKADIPSTELPRIKADHDGLAEAFAHIVQNAIEARTEDWEAEIKIRIEEVRDERGRDMQIVEIEDGGKGVAREIAKEIFSPFCTSKAKGMGIGLPLARRLVEDHGGDIHLQSPSRPTRFILRIPCDCGKNPAAAGSSNSDGIP